VGDDAAGIESDGADGVGVGGIGLVHAPVVGTDGLDDVAVEMVEQMTQ